MSRFNPTDRWPDGIVQQERLHQQWQSKHAKNVVERIKRTAQILEQQADQEDFENDDWNSMVEKELEAATKFPESKLEIEYDLDNAIEESKGLLSGDLMSYLSRQAKTTAKLTSSDTTEKIKFVPKATVKLVVEIDPQ